MIVARVTMIVLVLVLIFVMAFGAAARLVAAQVEGGLQDGEAHLSSQLFSRSTKCVVGSFRKRGFRWVWRAKLLEIL